MKQTEETFGDRLRQAREARGWTQDEFAEHAGMSRPHVSRYECGSVIPSVKSLVKLCSELGVTADWLLGLSEEGGP